MRALFTSFTRGLLLSSNQIHWGWTSSKSYFILLISPPTVVFFYYNFTIYLFSFVHSALVTWHQDHHFLRVSLAWIILQMIKQWIAKAVKFTLLSKVRCLYQNHYWISHLRPAHTMTNSGLLQALLSCELPFWICRQSSCVAVNCCWQIC